MLEWIVPVTPDQAVERMLSMRGTQPVGRLWRPSSKRPPERLSQPGHYGLGEGGVDPREPTPFTPDEKHGNRPACDCSGAVCWGIGIPRQLYNSRKMRTVPAFRSSGGYVSTGSLISEATRHLRDEPPSEWLELLTEPRRGAIIVYGNRYKNGERVRIGHCGLVTRAPEKWQGGTVEDFMRTQVAHSRGGSGFVHTTAQPFFGNDKQGHPKAPVFLWFKRYATGR